MIEVLALIFLMSAAIGWSALFGVTDPGEETDREDGGDDDDAGDGTPGDDGDDGEDDAEDDPSPSRLQLGDLSQFVPNISPIFEPISATPGGTVFVVPEGVEAIDITLNSGAVLDTYESHVGEIVFPDSDTLSPGPEIRGNSSPQTWNLGGSGYILRTGGGGDTIDIGEARNIVIIAGEGDTVIGPEGLTGLTGRGTYDVFIALTGGATYQGDLGSVTLVLTGEGNIVNGGPGNEGILVLEGGHALIGGEGNDRIIATPYGTTEVGATTLLSNFVNPAANLLDGGDGDDLLIGSFNDTLTGGTGIDEFQVYFDPSNPAAATGGALITDFVPAVERILLVYGAYPLVSPENFGLPLQDVMSMAQENGDTVIFGRNGEEVLRVAGATDLVIAFRQAGTSDYVTANGTPIEPANADIVVSPYTEDHS